MGLFFANKLVASPILFSLSLMARESWRDVQAPSAQMQGTWGGSAAGRPFLPPTLGWEPLSHAWPVPNPSLSDILEMSEVRKWN